MAQSDSIDHASSELNKKSKLNPTRVATDELQLQDLVIAEACHVMGFSPVIKRYTVNTALLTACPAQQQPTKDVR